MTESEKQVIIDAVISALRTNSRTIEQLTPVASLSASDYFEVSGGRRIAYTTLAKLIATLSDSEQSNLQTAIDRKELQSVAITTTKSSATLTIKSVGKTISCPIPIATTSQSGIITAADKVKLDAAYTNADSALNQAKAAQTTANTAKNAADTANSGVSSFNAKIGKPNGIANLDASGKVPTSQLPGYVDDVVEFNAFVQNITPQMMSSSHKSTDIGCMVMYNRDTNRFVLAVSNRQVAAADWSAILRPKKSHFVASPAIELGELTTSTSVKDFWTFENGNIAIIPSVFTFYPNWADGVSFGDIDADGRIPEVGKIYTCTSENKTFRWSGTELIVIGSDLGLGHVAGSAFPGDEGAGLKEQLEYAVNNIEQNRVRIEGLGILPCDGEWDGTGKEPTSGVWLCPNEKDTPSVYFRSFGNTDFYGIAEEVYNSDVMYNPGWLYRTPEGIYRINNDKLESISGSGSGFFNVTTQIPLPAGQYYDRDTAIAALVNADIEDEAKFGMILTFEKSAGVWEDYRFVSNDLTKFDTPASWEEYGGGKIKAIIFNGTEIAPDENGEVVLNIPKVDVDSTLDAESTNPVQNSVVTAELNSLKNSEVGDVEVISEDDKNTLIIYNKKGEPIAQTEFVGGGGGGGGSTASRIALSSSLDKTQVKEGGSAKLTYTYNHFNAENEPDGIRANITITVKSGVVILYEGVLRNVSAGTYTFDLTNYLKNAGTIDVYVKADATAEDGTPQTKQVWKSINVIMLAFSSRYNLANTIANGGYKNGDTIEIPFLIAGSGTKTIYMYLDGTDTPQTKTISGSSSGVEGSFTIQASSLTPGRHSVQMVAERDGFFSDSIYIDIFKAGTNAPFIGVKYTDPNGDILHGSSVSPKLTAGQYENLSFDFVAYDPNTIPALVNFFLNGVLTNTMSVPRTQQTYANRFTSQGSQTLTMTCGNTSYSLGLEITGSTININEATYGLIAKLDAVGRSNGESNPAIWKSGDVDVTFEGINWDSDGWTGESLLLTNGGKAIINYKPFEHDLKATGATLEITMKVSNSDDKESDVISCIDNGKGLLISAQEASFRTGRIVTYENEDGQIVTRDVKLGTNYVEDEWIKVAFIINTATDNRLMHLFVDGNRTGADIYDNSFSFAQDAAKNIVITSEHADVEIRRIRIYGRALTDDEELENTIVDSTTSDEMLTRYTENDILGETGNVDINKILAMGKGVLKIVRPNKLDDLYADNDKKKDFKADVYFYSPYGTEYNFVLKNCNIRIQGTSSTKYPSKNIRIYFNKGGETLELTINGVINPFGKNKYKMRPGSIPMNLFTMKSDYSDSSMSLNTGGAKLFNDVLKELGLLTPPQRYLYEKNGSLADVNIRTAIDGFPIDIFCSETEDGESEYYGQYNFNNEKSKSENLFGQDGVEGFTPTCPITLEMLNNGEKACLFQLKTDADYASFDSGAEFNYPEDTYWNASSIKDKGTVATDAQKTAIKRLYQWIADCVPAGATANNLATFKSQKFVDEIDQYFDKDFLLTYYLWTDYFLAVDQRAKNMMLRTWDGLKWYITYYDGDTQLGKRNDCFLVYTYTTDRDTYDASGNKYAFEGRESWLWNLVLANLADDLKSCASNLRGIMTNERVLNMLIKEQSGNWSDRAFNKSGDLKYIQPAIQTMYGKVWPFIYALQGANTAHRKYLIENRFALLDAKYGTSNFTSDNIDFYLARDTSDPIDTFRITASEVYAFGYGTNNSPNLANTGIVNGGESASILISGKYTLNDPLRMYGASRIRVLDATGAANHIKNGFDLSKCSSLRELNMQVSSGSGSTAWWLVISNCRALRKINLRNQAQARTGSTTSTELDFTNQGKLEYLDARGVQVQSVLFAPGSPITTAYLPSTLTTLKLEQLNQLPMSGLSLENWANIKTLIFSGCNLLDWKTILTRCTGVTRLRIILREKISDDGSFLRSLMNVGGIDENGATVNTCRLVGTCQLTKTMPESDYNAMVAHFPELNILQPPYTHIEHDESVADGTGWTNHDNETGYLFDNDFNPSGHITKILSQRHRVLAKNAASGSVVYFPLHDENSNYYADNENVASATPANLTGDEGDVMMYEPEYWYKGVNDFLNKGIKHSFFASVLPPDAAEHKWVKKETLEAYAGMAVSVSLQYNTLKDAAVVINGDSYYKMNVNGYKQVRFPGIKSAAYGAVFLDANDNIIDRMKATTDSGFLDGMYLFAKIPANAVSLAFTILTNQEYDDILLTMGEDIADIEPDWVKHEECLTGVYEAYVVDDVLRSISGVQSSVSITQPDFEKYASNRGKGWQLVDWEMHKDVANLYYAKYGKSDSQGTLGSGTNTSYRHSGLTNKIGMTDTFANPANTAEKSAYVWTNKETNTKENIQSPNCLGYENWWGHNAEFLGKVRFNSGKIDYTHSTTMPDGSARKITGLREIGHLWPCKMVHGRYMDIWIAMKDGSSTSYYFDENYISNEKNCAVARSYYYAYEQGGVANAGTYFGVSSSGPNFGSRLAFRGVIRKAVSVVAFKAIATM